MISVVWIIIKESIVALTLGKLLNLEYQLTHLSLGFIIPPSLRIKRDDVDEIFLRSFYFVKVLQAHSLVKILHVTKCPKNLPPVFPSSSYFQFFSAVSSKVILSIFMTNIAF